MQEADWHMEIWGGGERGGSLQLLLFWIVQSLTFQDPS